MKFLQQNWATAREVGIKDGYVLSYKILSKASEHQLMTANWNVMLMTEYADYEHMDKYFKDYRVIQKKSNPNGVEKVNGKEWSDFGKSILYLVLNDTAKKIPNDQ